MKKVRAKREAAETARRVRSDAGAEAETERLGAERRQCDEIRAVHAMVYAGAGGGEVSVGV